MRYVAMIDVQKLWSFIICWQTGKISEYPIEAILEAGIRFEKKSINASCCARTAIGKSIVESAYQYKKSSDCTWMSHQRFDRLAPKEHRDVSPGIIHPCVAYKSRRAHVFNLLDKGAWPFLNGAAWEGACPGLERRPPTGLVLSIKPGPFRWAISRSSRTISIP